MFFEVLNKSQRRIAASTILVLGIVQISLDSWALYKIQEHEEIILFLTGNAIPNSEMRGMTYDQAISYFSRLRGFLGENFLDTLGVLQMTVVLGLVAGMLELFSSTVAVLWKGVTVDIFWLVLNFIVTILLSVAVAYISLNMIRDVPYHQVLLTVTSVNLFILVHIWVLNVIALRNLTSGKDDEGVQVQVDQSGNNNAEASASSATVPSRSLVVSPSSPPPDIPPTRRPSAVLGSRGGNPTTNQVQIGNTQPNHASQ